MAIMPAEVQELINTLPQVVLATADAAGQPNACVIGLKKVIDDETVYISDQFFKKTLANLGVNPKVSVVLWGEAGAYQVHGTARYVNDGVEFAEQKAWATQVFEAMGLPLSAKGGVFIHVDAVYQVAAGPQAGEKIA